MRKSINIALGLVLIAATGFLSGCVIPGGLRPTSNKNFAARVEAAVPLGSTEEEATRVMTANGYHCSIRPSDPYRPGAHQPARTVVCGSEGAVIGQILIGQIFDRDWSVFFLIEDGRVAKIAAVTDLDAS